MTTAFPSQTAPNEGLRDTKRRETYARIADAGLRLFFEHGYDATTLEMVAEEVGIARRTFFSYFKSKDEILVAWERRRWQEVVDEVLMTSPDEVPLKAVRGILDRSMGRSNDAQLKEIARLTSSSSALAARRHASFAEREYALYQALCEVWRQPERRTSLRVVALIATGALRIAVERWEQGDNKRSLQRLYRESFDVVEGVLSKTA